MEAHVCAVRLDRELAAGAVPWSSPRHVARALWLTSSHQRVRLAVGLERLLLEARYRPLAGKRLSMLIRPDRRSVLGCESLIVHLVGVLRGPDPVTAEGVARLRRLLCDGTGPVYLPDPEARLERALERIIDVIPAPD